MSESIIVGLIAAGASVLVSIINNRSQSKKITEELSRNNEKQINEMEKHNELQAFQIQELTKQVEKHNKVIERVFQLEKDEAVMQKELKVANHRIDDLEKYHK